MIVNFSKRVGIIPKIGAGIKMRDVEFSNQRNLVVRLDYEFSDVIIFPSSNHLKTEGFVSRFNFNLELQFFYKF